MTGRASERRGGSWTVEMLGPIRLIREVKTLAAAARILSERCIGSVWAVSLRGSSGIARLTVHTDRENLVIDEALIGPTAARELAEAVKEHNARRSARP